MISINTWILFLNKSNRYLKFENLKILTENKMKHKIDDLELMNIGNCIEIKGIPKTILLMKTDIIQDIVKKVKSHILIKSVHRILIW